ncbi:hypothetical protein DW908_01175 [Bifidobacterium longum]|nr:hypothetical protein DW908_01175 [Bifidobacterium longum]
MTYEGYWKSCVPRYSREPTSPPAIRTIPTFILAFGLTRATMTARRVEGHDDATDRATGESAGILGAAGVSTGPSMGPAIFCCSPRNSQRQFHNKRYRNSQWPCHRLRNRLCRSRNKRPARINRNSRAGPMLLPAPTRIRQWPSRTNHQSRKSDSGVRRDV